MKKLFFILFIILSFIGCQEELPESGKNKVKEISHLDKLRLAKEIRDNKHEHRNEDYQGWETFIHEKEEFVISYPNSWKIQEEIDDVVVLSVMKEDTNETKFQENFHLIILDVDDSTKADKAASDFYFEQQELYKEIGSFNLIDEGFVGESYNGENWFLEYEIERKDSENMYSVNMFFHRKGKLYIICFYTIMERKEELDPIFDKVIRSFGW